MRQRPVAHDAHYIGKFELPQRSAVQTDAAMVAQNKNFALANRLLRDIVIFAPIFPQIRLFDLFERILARFFAVQLAVFGIDCVSGEPDNPLDYPLMLRLVVNAVSLVRFDYDDIPVFRGNSRIDKQIIALI